mgnify:FL=1
MTVYNLEIEDNHNYYVSENMILAHNLKSTGGGGGIRSPMNACFLGPTLIQMRNGTKSIQDIEIGDEVKTVNLTTWAVEYQPVVNKYGAEISDYYRIEVGKEDIFTTENHRFWVIGYGWVKTTELKAGDKMYSEHSVETVQFVEHITSQVPTAVYNIEVKDNQNYLVTKGGFLAVDRWPFIKEDHLRE